MASGQMMSLPTVSEIESKVAKIGRDLSLATGLAGFIYGVDAKFVAGGGPGYPYTKQGLEDVVAQIAGPKYAKMIDPTYSGAAVKVFNPWAIMNQGTYLAIALHIAHDSLKGGILGRAAKVAYDVGFAPAIGYGIGRVFDDPISTSGGIQGVIPSGNYTPNVRNGLAVGSNAPWTT